MKGIIELTGMRFEAFHGCLPEERENGNLFVVDFRCRYDLQKASESDDLADTLDYGAVYDIVAREMAVPSNLLEHVAGRIARTVKASFPDAAGIVVCVAKKNPPVAGQADWSKVSVEID